MPIPVHILHLAKVNPVQSRLLEQNRCVFRVLLEGLLVLEREGRDSDHDADLVALLRFELSLLPLCQVAQEGSPITRDSLHLDAYRWVAEPRSPFERKNPLAVGN